MAPSEPPTAADWRALDDLSAGREVGGAARARLRAGGLVTADGAWSSRARSLAPVRASTRSSGCALALVGLALASCLGGAFAADGARAGDGGALDAVAAVVDVAGDELLDVVDGAAVDAGGPADRVGPDDRHAPGDVVAEHVDGASLDGGSVDVVAVDGDGGDAAPSPPLCCDVPGFTVSCGSPASWVCAGQTVLCFPQGSSCACEPSACAVGEACALEYADAAGIVVACH